MYNYRLIDVPIVDETIESITAVDHQQLQNNDDNNSVSIEQLSRQRNDGFTSLTNYMNYRMNSMESQISNLTAMVSELLEKTRGI